MTQGRASPVHSKDGSQTPTERSVCGSVITTGTRNRLSRSLSGRIIGSNREGPISLHPLYEVSPFIEASGNTPPFIGFSENGPFVQGPRGQSTSLTATVSSPLTLTVWVADDAKSTVTVTRFAGLPVTVAWSKFCGPGAV